MHWRNIHIQNPYNNTGQATDRPQRFTPKRKQRSGSQHDCSVFSVSHSSKQHRSQKGSKSKKKRQLFKISTNKTIMVTEQWVTNVKTHISKLVQLSHALCAVVKNHVWNIEKTLKMESDRIKSQTMKKMTEFANKIMSTLPKKDNNNYLIKQIDEIDKINHQSSQLLVRPFVLTDCEIDSSLNQIMSISKSIGKKDKELNSPMKSLLDICVCGRAKNTQQKTVTSTIKKSRSVNPFTELLSEKIQSENVIQKQKQKDEKSTKQDKPYALNQKQLTKDNQIKSETILKGEAQCNPEQSKSAIDLLKKSIKSQNKNLTFNQKYNFYKKMISDTSRKSSKNSSMDETMHNMTTCIASMKKILSNPSKK